MATVVRQEPKKEGISWPDDRGTQASGPRTPTENDLAGAGPSARVRLHPDRWRGGTRRRPCRHSLARIAAPACSVVNDPPTSGVQ
jgi:hypothetical protein